MCGAICGLRWSRASLVGWRIAIPLPLIPDPSILRRMRIVSSTARRIFRDCTRRRAGYAIIGEVGVENIRAKSTRQTSRLIALAEEEGYPVNSPKDSSQRGGTVTLDVPNGYEVTQELLRRDFLLDYRPGAGIRVAPHFYTKDEELDQVIQEIQSFARSLQPV